MKAGLLAPLPSVNFGVDSALPDSRADTQICGKTASVETANTAPHIVFKKFSFMFASFGLYLSLVDFEPSAFTSARLAGAAAESCSPARAATTRARALTQAPNRSLPRATDFFSS